MFRWIVSLSVLVAMMVVSNEAFAQRRQPVRNFARQIGVRWSAGYHWANPGTQFDYYSPYSTTNSSQNDHNSQPTPADQNTETNQNSATRLFEQPRSWQIRPNQENWSQPVIGKPAIDENTTINQFLKPYHRSTNDANTINPRPTFQNSLWPAGQKNIIRNNGTIQNRSINIRSNQNDAEWNNKYGGYFDINSTENQK